MNAYSIVHNFDQPVYTPDFDLVTTALNFKQTKLNHNREKLSNMYEQFAALQVRNGYYQEYIEDRLKKVLDINRNYHNMDLSDDNFAAVVSGNVSQILDEHVKGAIADTRRMDAEDKEWEEKRVKADGKYSSINHEYAIAMSDRNRYLSTREKGNRYQGGAQFIEYSDYSEKWSKTVKDLKDRLGWTYFETSPGVGGFMYQDKKQVVKPEDVRAEMMRVFNANDLRQMQIDGWAQYKDMEPQRFGQIWNSKIDNEVSMYDQAIKNLQAEVNSGKLTESQKQERENLIQQLNGRISETKQNSFENLYDPNNPDPRKLASLQGSFYQQQYMQSIVDSYSGVNHLERKLDAVSAEYMKYKQRENHFQKRLDFDTLKFSSQNTLDWAKTKITAYSKGLEWDKDTQEWVPIGQNITGPTDPRATFTRDNVEAVDGITLVGEYYDKKFQASNTIRSMFNYDTKDGKKAGWLNPSQLTEVIQGITKGDLAETVAQGGLYKTKDGRTLDFSKLTAEKRKDLLTQATIAYSSDPKIEAYEKELGKTVKDGITEFSKLVAPGGDLYNKSNTLEQTLPRFRFKITTDEKGNLITENINGGQKEFEKLLVKKRNQDTGKGSKLTPIETKTLEAYMAFSLSMQSDLSTEQRKAYRHYAKNIVLADVKINENHIPKPYYGSYSSSDKNQPSENLYRKQPNDTYSDTGGRSLDLSYWNRKFLGKDGKEHRAAPYLDNVKNRLSLAEQNLKTAWESEAMDSRYWGNYVTSKDNPALYNDLTKIYGGTVDPKKDVFAFYRETDSAGKITGNIKFGVVTDDIKKGEELNAGEKTDKVIVKQVKTMTPQQVQYLEQTTGTLAPIRSNYAEGYNQFGQKELTLGNQAVSNSIQKSAKLKSAEEDFKLTYSNKQHQDFALQTYERFLKGDFTFSAEYVPELGYTFIMRDPKISTEDDNIVAFYSPDVPLYQMTHDHINQYRVEARKYAEALVIQEYIPRQIDRLRNISK